MCPKRPKRRLGNVTGYGLIRRCLFSFDIWYSIFRFAKLKKSISWPETNVGPPHLHLFAELNLTFYISPIFALPFIFEDLLLEES